MINLKVYLISELLHKVGVGTEEEMENVMHKLAGWKPDCNAKNLLQRQHQLETESCVCALKSFWKVTHPVSGYNFHTVLKIRTGFCFFYRLLLRPILEVWKDVSLVKSTGCSPRGAWFNS